jgi:hypothetical protein
VNEPAATEKIGSGAKKKQDYHKCIDSDRSQEWYKAENDEDSSDRLLENAIAEEVQEQLQDYRLIRDVRLRDESARVYKKQQEQSN